MNVVFSLTNAATKYLKSIPSNNQIRIIALMIAFFVIQSFQSFSNGIAEKENFTNTNKSYSILKTLPETKSSRINNFISFNSLLKTSYCTGESGSVLFDAQGVYNLGNVFSVVLSDSIGSFTNPTIIGSLSGVLGGVNTLNFKIPVNISLGTGYRFRIVASNPLTTSNDNNFNIQITTIPIPIGANQVICAGQSIALAATCNVGTVQWYKSLNGDTLLTSTTVSPNVTTIYYAACQDGITCYSKRKPHTVTVNNLSGVSLAAAFSSCANSDLNLPVITAQTNLTYAWTGPNNFTSTTKTAAITNLTSVKAGTYSVSVTNANNCSVRLTTLVSISQSLPNLSIAGDTTICYNGTINLSAQSGATSGFFYVWTGPNAFTATGQSISRAIFTDNGQGLITYHDGIYSVTATNLSTGCSGTARTTIYVGDRPNMPTIPSITAFCEGTTQNITVGFSGANFQKYSWTGPNGFTSTSIATCNPNLLCTDANITIPNFSNSNVGAYSVIGYFRDVFNKTCSVSANASLSIKPKPAITVTSNSAICTGQNLNFNTTNNNTNVGIATYSWTGPNGFTSNIQNPSVNVATASASGTYTLVVVGVNQCAATATSTAIVTQSLPPIVPPTVQVVLSNSITLTATGCAGTVEWYKKSDNQGVTMPISPIITTLYYAKCNLSGCVSAKSGDVTVTIGAPIAISIKSGNWNDRTTWNINRVPLPIDSVYIDSNHIVVISGQYSAKWMGFKGNGTITFGANSAGNLNLLGNPPPPKTTAPTLLTVTGTQLTYSGYTNGTTLKLYKNGVYINLSVVANSGIWTGLSLTAGLYTLTATDDGMTESVASNAIQFTPQTATPTLLTVTGTQTTYSSYATGTTLKLYKNGVYTNLSTTANASTWSGLTLTTGSYTITSTEANKSESGQSNVIQYSSLPQTSTPTLLAVNATYITYTNYTPGAVFKLYKNGVFTNDTFVSNGNEWTGLNLGTGLYTYTATESGKSESAQSNAVQFTQPNGQTGVPTLSTVTGNTVTFSGYTTGTTIKLYRNGIYLNQSYVAINGQWTGLSLSTGLYSITATETGKYESAQSNTIQYNASNTQTTTPVLLTVSGSRISYSTYTIGTTLKLYKGGVYTNLSHVATSNEWTGLNLSTGIYSITATDPNKTQSGLSNTEQYTSPSTAVIITEPNKPQYYFSDGHPASYYDGNINLPVIFTNQPQYNATNDFVWLKNDKIKIGINLKRGGQLAWASLLDATTNLVYNGYDGGFQVTLDAYQKKDGYTQGGEIAGSGIPGTPTSHNVTQGGDFLNNAVSLIDYHSIPNGYYVKIRPIHYPMTAKLSETYIEAWYTIIRQSVKIQYRYTSFRTDGQWVGGGFDGAGAPACFIVNTLNRYKTYTGSNPWTFSPPDAGVLPITNLGGTPVGSDASEFWGMVYDPQKPESGFGVYNDTPAASTTHFTFKQKEVYPGNGPGTEFANGYTFMQSFVDFNIPNRGSYVKDITAYVMLGTEFEIRAEAYRISGHENNIPQY